MPAAAGAPAMSGALEATSGLFENAVKDLRDSLTCQICLKLLYEPFTTSCGHTYCYECLNQWFAGNGDGLKKTCPDCRSRISQQPAPAYLVRQMVEVLCKKNELLPEGETVEEHVDMRQDMVNLVEKHKSDKSRKGGLFEGRFNHPDRPNAIKDAHDGIWRCPDCTVEPVDYYCQDCDLAFDEEGAPVRNDSFYDSVSDYSGDELDVMGDQLVDVEAVPTRTTHPMAWGPLGLGHRPHVPFFPRHYHRIMRLQSPTETEDSYSIQTDPVPDTSDEEDDDDDADLSDFIDDEVPESGEVLDDDHTVENHSPLPMPETEQSFLDDGTPDGSVSSDTIQDPYAESPRPDSPTGDFSSVDGSHTGGWEDHGHHPFTSFDSLAYRDLHTGDEDADLDEEEDDDDGYNMAGMGPYSDDEEDSDETEHAAGESEDGYDEDDEPVLDITAISRKRARPVVSSSEEDSEDEVSVQPKRRRQVMDVSSQEDPPESPSGQTERSTVVSSSPDADAWNNSRPTSNTNASRAPMRAVVNVSDESDSDVPQQRTRRGHAVTAHLSGHTASNSRLPSTNQRKRESSSLAATSRSVASRA